MFSDQTRADKARRAIIADPAEHSPQSGGKGTRVHASWWRRGLALAAVSGIAVAAAVTFSAAASVSIRPAFANQVSLSSDEIASARDQGADRKAVRTEVSIDDLAKQRSALIEVTSEQIEDGQKQAALQGRQSQLKDAATAVETEAERLRNLANFLWPTEGEVSSGYGLRLHPILRYYRLHDGADIGGTCGQPIYAAQSGTVTKAAAGGYNGGSGNNVRIDHGDINGINVQTGYLHMSKILVEVGQVVEKGQLIGNVGNTGLSTSCHLHLSLYKNGRGSDPLEYVHKNSPKESAKEESGN